MDAVRVGLELCAAFVKLYPGKVDFARGRTLIGRDDVIRRLLAGQDPEEIVDSYREGVAAFVKVRARYLLYK
jgi:uncharacterized protein YbbC (DUF1343 family)